MTLNTETNDHRVIGYVLLNRIDVRRANALSGHIAYGFPSVTAFKGLTHALTRALYESGEKQLSGVSLRGVMLACHDYEIYGRQDKFKQLRFSQFSSPASTMTQIGLLRRTKRLPSIVEQAFVDLNVSLVFEIVAQRDLLEYAKSKVEHIIFDFIRKKRVAGGVVQPNFSINDVEFVEYENLNDVAYKISDSFILTDAQELMRQYLEENPDENALDAILRLSSRSFSPAKDEEGDIKMKYNPLDKKYRGLGVMSVGFQGIAPSVASPKFKGSTSQNREDTYTQYVESVYGLVNWELPHVLRINGFLRHSFWVYSEPTKTPDIYLISQPNISKMYNQDGV